MLSITITPIVLVKTNPAVITDPSHIKNKLIINANMIATKTPGEYQHLEIVSNIFLKTPAIATPIFAIAPIANFQSSTPKINNIFESKCLRNPPLSPPAILYAPAPLAESSGDTDYN